METLYLMVGFLLASYSVIANDSVQTLGTWIASNQKFKWQYLCFAAVSVLLITLWYFKSYNSIPMSTTWLFVVLLAGRELAFATINDKYKFKTVFPLVGRDFFKMMIELALSIVIVFLIHGFAFSGFANL